jgi:hypothetical protein
MLKKGKPMKSLLTLAVSAALVLPATSAFADNLADTIMARPSTEATAGIHLSLGGKAHTVAKPVYGASLGFRAGGQSVSQAYSAPAAKVAEFNFSGGKVEDARLGAMNFAKGDTVAPDGNRMDLFGMGTMGWVWVGVGLILVWVIADNNSNDNNGGY